jgi:hypothetical protein
MAFSGLSIVSIGRSITRVGGREHGKTSRSGCDLHHWFLPPWYCHHLECSLSHGTRICTTKRLLRCVRCSTSCSGANDGLSDRRPWAELSRELRCWSWYRWSARTALNVSCEQVLRNTIGAVWDAVSAIMLWCLSLTCERLSFRSVEDSLVVQFG